MKLIVCVDDSCGLMFNNRRLSRDKRVVEEISRITEGFKLWVSEYSSELFSDYSDSVSVSDNLYKKCNDDEYCFVENIDIGSNIDSANEVVIFKWNRKYPSDTKFPVKKVIDELQLLKSVEFEGSSHTKITMEVYTR